MQGWTKRDWIPIKRTRSSFKQESVSATFSRLVSGGCARQWVETMNLQKGRC